MSGVVNISCKGLILLVNVNDSRDGYDGAGAAIVEFGGGVICGEWLLLGSSVDGEVVLPRFNVTLTSYGREVAMVLVGEDLLDEPTIM
ncbi:hypothetical protein Tco_1020114 [Tanacetum coccineum]|uniref:Uncharacterized protein n=1 Tax=Tanacetum coccineum TaxID=301880 RepID=A0ABQ5FZ69_9ASTR